jgi:glyoxylase-like metal-dependent hydrolase (beta-lactamase superfamily II)
LAEVVDAPIFLHPADSMLWREVYPDRAADGELSDAMIIHAGDSTLKVLHTPGHRPGGCCFYNEEHDVLFSGDTLFRGGPGATGRSFSDYATIVASIRDVLLALPSATRVLTGHGDETTIGAEAPSLPEWEAKI